MYFNYNLSSVITLFDGDPREFKQLIKVEKYGVLSGKQGHEISILAYIACKSLMGVFIKRYLDKQMRQKKFRLRMILRKASSRYQISFLY